MSHLLHQINQKKSRLVLGIMSGTSADGIDVALCRIHGHGLDTSLQLLAFAYTPFEAPVRNEILRIAGGEEATARDFCQMNFLLGQLYRDAALALCQREDIAIEEIDLIGSHGQTLWHIPLQETYLGRPLRSTLQLGECAVLADAFGCPVIGDFRVRDVAAGGLGAPLVPYSEFLIYRKADECIALQNIGGIGNITCLPPNCRLEDVFAFDTGPGNMLMDAAIQRLTGGKYTYDDNGAYAAAGRVHPALMRLLMADAYLEKAPPKTTGREYYGPGFLQNIFDQAKALQVSDRDLMATVTAYTAETIALSIRQFFPHRPDRLIVGGGGSMNATLMQALRTALPDCLVQTNEDIGYDSNAKEAVAFAVLANEALFESCNNVPSVTGARAPVVMGKISLP